MNDNDLIERLAAYAHESWSGWMKYLFTKGQHTEQLEGGGTFTIDAGSVRRWTYQMNTSYAELPENMKPSDREEARKIIAIIEAGLVEVE